MCKIELFKTLSNCNCVGVSSIVDVEIFNKKDFRCLKLGNGGSWCRFDGKFGKYYKIITVKKNGTIRYSWNVENLEKENLEKKVNFYMKEKKIQNQKGINIKLIKMCGVQGEIHNRPIGRRIKKYFKDMPCVSCGSNSNLEIDHKNGLYNDPEVLDVKTQKIEHFQSLCKHCNDQKRQTIKTMLKDKKRYKSTNIPMLKIFNVDFTIGGDEYDPNDPNWGIGTYWFDPIEFMINIKNLI